MRYSTQGYKSNSPDRNRDFNLIPSGRITMKDVPHPILGTDNLGNRELLMPGQEYQFPGNSVYEVPLKDNNMKKMKQGGSAAGHSGMFWNGERWVSSADGATYNNGTFYRDGGPTFPVGGAGAMFKMGGNTASFYIDGNGYPQPFAMSPGSGQGSGMLQDLPTHMQMGGIPGAQLVHPFAMNPGSGMGNGMLQEYASETMKKGGKHKAHPKMSPQQMQMMQQAMMQQQGPPQGSQMMPPQQGQPMMPPQGMPGQPMMMMGGQPCYKCGGMHHKMQAGGQINPYTTSDVRYPNQINAPAPMNETQMGRYNRMVDPNKVNQFHQSLYNTNSASDFFGAVPDIHSAYYGEPVQPILQKDNFQYRKNLAERQYGISNYRGTATQNMELLNKGKNTLNNQWNDWQGHTQPASQQYGGMPDHDGDVDVMKSGGHWIQGAVNPAHKGYCTPMTKSTCTPKRKAFAETMKKHHGFHEMGGAVTAGGNIVRDNEMYQFGGHPLSRFMQGGGRFSAQGDPNDETAIPSMMPATGPNPNNPNDARNLDPQYAQQNNASGTGVVAPMTDPANTAAWRQGMTDQQAQQNLNDRPSAATYGQQIAGPTRGYNWAGFGLGMIGTGLGVASVLADRRDARNLRSKNFNDRSTANAFPAQNQPGGMGDYDQYGNFRPNQNTPTRAGYFPNQSPVSQYGGTFANGGMYHAGQEVELSDAEIKRLRSMGYKVDML